MTTTTFTATMTTRKRMKKVMTISGLQVPRQQHPLHEAQ
jgi:hypothetical protein